MDFLNKELEKNKKFRDLIYKQLDRDKKEFIREMRSGLGDEIKVGSKEQKEKNNISFWEKLKKIFN